jgi:ketosteroid isomerase-like protein
MSRANMEVAKRQLDAYNQRDLETLFAELVTPDVEWFPGLIRGFEGGAYRGRQGIETYFREIRDTWEELRAVPEEFRDLGDRVLILGRIEGRGRGSGAQVNAPQGIIDEFRGDRISCVRGYLDHGEALRAAGLSE